MFQSSSSPVSSESAKGRDEDDARARELLRLVVGDVSAADALWEGASRDGAAALVPHEAVVSAVLAPEGVVWIDKALADLIPDLAERTDVRLLAQQARAGGLARTALELETGPPLLACALSGDAALSWARSDEARQALGRPGAALLLAFTPARSAQLSARAAAAFGLTPAEARIAEAFLFAPTIEVAAEQCGLSRLTARDAIGRVAIKLGVRRSADVVRRLTELMCGVGERASVAAPVLGEVFGLTPAEAGVAAMLAGGATHKEAAVALGLAQETVRGYAKSVLLKARAPRVKDFVRLATEAGALERLTDAAEPVFVAEERGARLRLLPRPDGRNVAFLDYGPLSARPAVIFHGFIAGRSLPPALVRALQGRGLRPLVPQRPGFGLTTPARGDYLAAAADDLAFLVERLQLADLALFARDGGVAAALAFATGREQLIRRGVLLNPRAPGPIGSNPRPSLATQISRFLLERPDLISGFANFIRRRSRTEVVQKLVVEGLKGIPGDVAMMEDPAVLAQLVRDVQAQFAHSCAGYIAEHSLYAQGWTPPPIGTGPSWTLLYSAALSLDPSRAPVFGLPQCTSRVLPAAGVLAQFTHVEDIADALAP